MKCSVSIPDELWLKVKILFPEMGNSEVIQVALNAMVEGVEPSPEQLMQLWERIK